MTSRPKKNVTISDVARMAGVSVTTVSRILNGEKYVREGKKKAVDAAVEKLGYRPSLYARSLAGKRSYLIALMLDDPQGDYLSSIQRGLLRKCKQAGQHVVVEVFDHTTTFEQIESFLSSLGLSGVILTPPLCDNEVILTALNRRNTPTVRIAPSKPFGGMIDITIDNYSAAYHMTKYLIELGHTDIGFICGDSAHADARERQRGFQAAMSDHGLLVRRDWVVDGTYVFASGIRAARQILDAEKVPTAIFASNDEMAAATITVARDLGMQVPEYLSVVGFDDMPLASFVTPPLTTIRQPIEDMAVMAASLLLAANSKPGSQDEEPSTCLSFAFVERKSATKPRS